MKPLSYILISIFVGVLLGVAGMWLINVVPSKHIESQTDERKPLYWVAPMDPNYQRDKPGKSPMGMDLIPVYASDNTEQATGTITVSPDVVNNLGVRTATVTRGALPATVNTVGYVQYNENKLVHITPRVDGWIEKLHVKAVGDPVNQGTALYELYSPMLVNAQEELLLAVKRNNTVLIQAATERLAALHLSEKDIDRLKTSGKINRTVTISAPQSGVLDNLSVREGMFVRPGVSMMVIAKPDYIWVMAEIFERQLARVKVGDNVRVRLDYLPDREWHGSVEYLYPSLDNKTRTAQVRVNINNQDGALKPGMFAQIDIRTQPSAHTLLIPQEALIRTGKQSRVVLALGDGRFKSIAVEVGQISEQLVQILSGLQEGDRIVTSAQFLIDSESSKTSDFKRMAHSSDEQDEPAVAAASVWVAAKVEELMSEHRMATLTHEAIDDWQWPAMTMDFNVADTVDMSQLKVGMTLHVEIQRDGDSDYRIINIHIPDIKPTTDHEHPAKTGEQSSKDNGDNAMDHNQHNEEGGK